MRSDQQALSDKYKEAVKSWVPKVRKVLENDLTAQLDRLGIRPTGKPTPVEQMQFTEESKALRSQVEALLRREILSEGDTKRGYQSVLREIVYTFLNRLVGLKCMEARKVLYLPPPGDQNEKSEQTEVITPVPGQSRSRYLRDFRAAGGSRYKYEDDAEEALLRDGLTAVFRHITREIRILYDPDHEYSSVWPTHAALLQLIDMINNDLPEEAYQAPDFLGWVYQFFNREEKKRVREETQGTPRSSYELAVLNQFYTPAWVVKVLVDNTLGRLWLQMHPDSSIRPQGLPPLPEEQATYETIASYLVPETGEKCRYESSLHSGEVEEFKLARDITLLDPACGTMHFGQYAYEIFHRMYEEEIENAGRPGWPSEPSIESREKIPVAIIENNLFGIDIDPRAIQIASLSLLLTAKDAALKHGLHPNEVRIKRTNLVVANSVDLGKEQLRNLVKRVNGRFGSPDIQERLFESLWENLHNVGELGSLVQVREGVKRILDDWVENQARMRGLTAFGKRQSEQKHMFEAQIAKQLKLQRRLLEEEAARLKDELFQAVESAAAQAAADPSERLFAEDTARGLRLLQILSHRYDVILMNPPYGSPTLKTRDVINEYYSIGRNDIYSAFIERSLSILKDDGYVGALTSRSFFTGPRYYDFRTALLGNHFALIWIGDLGPNILDDATVSTAAYVIKRRNKECKVVIYDLECNKELRESTFVDILQGKQQNRIYNKPYSFFLQIPDHRLAYKLFSSLDYAFQNFPPLFPEYLEDPKCVGNEDFSPKIAAVVQGIIPVPLEWFCRYDWEVTNTKVDKWRPLAKGGDFGRFWCQEDLIIDWENQGAKVKAEARRRYGSVTRTIKNTRYFGTQGLTFPRVSSIGFCCRHMPEGAVFTDKGQLIFISDVSNLSNLLGLLNSELAITVLDILNPSRFTEINDLSLLPIPSPIPDSVGEIADRITDLKANWGMGVEPGRLFQWPHILNAKGSIIQRLNKLPEIESSIANKVQSLYTELNEIIEVIYQISSSDRKLVREFSEHLSTETVWPQMDGRSLAQKRMEHVWRLLSYLVKRIMEEDADGIVPYVALSGESSLLEQIIRQLEILFPDQSVSQVEVDIVNELKQKVKGYRSTRSVQEWLNDVFFEDHVSLYKNRPIFWHIASAQGKTPAAFGALIHYHKFDKNRMAKLRASHLRDAIELFRREAALAAQEKRESDRLDWLAKLEEAQGLDRRLQLVQEGYHEGPEGGDHDFRILTPWKTSDDRPKGWDPDLDDGVKVNIEPLQRAGVLRIAKVV